MIWAIVVVIYFLSTCSHFLILQEEVPEDGAGVNLLRSVVWPYYSARAVIRAVMRAFDD